MVREINTDVLKQSAAKLLTLREQFQAEVNKLYAEIENLNVTYKGQASSAFNAKIEGYRPAFDELAKLVNAYSEYLTSVANNTEMTEEAILEAAQKLITIG